MDRWEGKLAVVTGAGSGIGAAIAEALAKDGVDVLAVDTKIVRLFSLKERAKNYLGKIYPQQVDVTKEEEVLAAFKWAKEKYGGVDILINNAGVTHIAKITEGDTEGFRRVLETNVIAVALFTKEAIKSMREKGSDGHIVNINSVFGHNEVPNLNRGLYPPSKTAVTVITETVRKELAQLESKIKITSISPGAVETDISETAAAETGTPYTKKDIPRLQPSDVAEAVTYVLSTPPNVQIAEYTIRPFGEAW